MIKRQGDLFFVDASASKTYFLLLQTQMNNITLCMIHWTNSTTLEVDNIKLYDYDVKCQIT